MASKINFAEDYVFVITSYMSAFMPNKLPDAMKGIALTYSSTSFLKKLSEASAEGVCVAKMEDKYLCVQVGSTEAFMKFQRIKVNYKMYVEKKSKDLGVVVDRLYLKDVLKRMGNLSTDGKVLILEDGSIQVENSNFHQVIPVNNAKDGVSGIGFNISIPILEKVILGRDDIFSGDIFLIDEEKIDAGCAVSGCGPAFVYMFIEAIADEAVACGLTAEQAYRYACTTLRGAAKTVLETKKSPKELRDAVCSPAGSTIEGVRALESGEFYKTVRGAVKASFERTKELGK